MLKKLFTLLFGIILLAGCQTVEDAVEDARNLQASVSVKIEEARTGIENVVGEAKEAYATLLEKKKQLEEMMAEVNEAVEAINKLLGKDEAAQQDELAAEKVELQQTITELQAVLEQANSAIAAGTEADEVAAENGTVEPAEESATE